MSFENKQFEAALAVSMKSLANLDKALRSVGTTTGLSDISRAAAAVNFGNVGNDADKLKQKLNFDGAAKSLGDIQGASDRVNFGGIS